MDKKGDPFARPTATDVAVRAGIEGSGISVKAKSRAFSAFDRLLGAALDIPGAWLERRAERARLIAVTEQEAMKIDAQAFLQQRREQGGVCSESIWLRDAKSRIDNRSEVASYAIEEMKLLENSHEETQHDDDDDDVYEYSFEDWLNAYVCRADMASSTQMRSILGRILAGEIAKPRSFSVATLRIVAELDQRTASNFQALSCMRIQERFLPKLKGDWIGQRMMDLYDLEERGLIKEVGGSVKIDLNKDPQGMYFLCEKDRLLHMTIEPVNEYVPVSTVVNLMVLTHSGLQLASLLPYDKEAGLRVIAGELATHDAVKLINLMAIEQESLRLLEKLFDRNA